MIIMGIDPGYAIVGFGVIEWERGRATAVRYGAVRTPSTDPLADRLCAIYEDIGTLIREFRPDAAAIEALFFNTNLKTAVQVGQARGVVVLAAAQQHVPLYEYTPLQVKQSVVGYGRAEKKQVMEMTRMLLGLPSVPKPDDAADALAVALCHAHTAASGLFGQSGGAIGAV